MKRDFDDDGLISIEDFEEIEAQKMGAKFKAGLEKSRQNFQEQLNNLIARYRKVDEDFFEALEEMLITADVGFNTVMTLAEELRMEHNDVIFKICICVKSLLKL